MGSDVYKNIFIIILVYFTQWANKDEYNLDTELMHKLF